MILLHHYELHVAQNFRACRLSRPSFPSNLQKFLRWFCRSRVIAPQSEPQIFRLISSTPRGTQSTAERDCEFSKDNLQDVKSQRRYRCTVAKNLGLLGDRYYLEIFEWFRSRQTVVHTNRAFIWTLPSLSGWRVIVCKLYPHVPF